MIWYRIYICVCLRQVRRNIPVAKISPSYNSRQIIRDVLMGNKERWLQSEEIWQCFWCANCYTVCPMDIHFPLLMMQIRYRALEQRYGVKYIIPFKRFALRAIEEGLTFAPAKVDRGIKSCACVVK